MSPPIGPARNAESYDYTSVADLLDADGLSSKDLVEIDFFVAQTKGRLGERIKGRPFFLLRLLAQESRFVLREPPNFPIPNLLRGLSACKMVDASDGFCSRECSWGPPATSASFNS
jgi:hypothetical protein